jgi:tetratricopeptide (TPR) repeat protein
MTARSGISDRFPLPLRRKPAVPSTVVAQVLDLEQALLLLELEPPFGKREVQLARRNLAKRWHPDIAPPGRQHEHERHLKAINEAADQLEALAEQSRGGTVSKNAVKVSAAAARAARAEEGRRAYEAEQRAREHAAERRRHDPFGARVPDHSVVHRYARCLSYPEWGVGTVEGIYFTGEGDDVQQWARVRFQPGIRTVPAGSLQFVDFSTPDPGAERVERFMTAAQHALAEGDFDIAAKRLVYARDSDPQNTSVLRLLTLAFWQAGNLEAAARAVRDWARVERERPAPHRYAARIYEDMGAIDLAAEAADRAAERAPGDPEAWERVGRLRLRLMQREAALEALERARRSGPSLDGLLDLALAFHLAGDVGGEVSATEQAVDSHPDSVEAWSRHAFALARTDRVREGIEAAERAIGLGADGEVSELLARLRDELPRVLPAA